MKIISDKETRSFIAAMILVLLVVGLIAYLTFVKVPEGNKDIIVTIIGSFTGSIGVAVAIMLGTNKNTEEIQELKSGMENLKGRYTELSNQFDDFKDRLLKINDHKLE